MLQRRAAERPQRILQTLGQRDEALAAEHDMGMLEAREGQPEVIEPMRQRDAGNRDAEAARVGEVGQAEPAGLVLLAEDHVLLRPVQRPPGLDAPLQRAPDVAVELGMAPAQFFEARRSPECRAPPSGSARSRCPKTPPSGSGRRRPRGGFFCDGRRGSASIR